MNGKGSGVPSLSISAKTEFYIGSNLWIPSQKVLGPSQPLVSKVTKSYLTWKRYPNLNGTFTLPLFHSKRHKCTDNSMLKIYPI